MAYGPEWLDEGIWSTIIFVVAAMLFGLSLFLDYLQRKAAVAYAREIASPATGGGPVNIPDAPPVLDKYVAVAAIIATSIAFYIRGLVNTSLTSEHFSQGACANVICTISTPRQAVVDSSVMATLSAPKGVSLNATMLSDGVATKTGPFIQATNSNGLEIYAWEIPVTAGRHLLTTTISSAAVDTTTLTLSSDASHPVATTTLKTADCVITITSKAIYKANATVPIVIDGPRTCEGPLSNLQLFVDQSLLAPKFKLIAIDNSTIENRYYLQSASANAPDIELMASDGSNNETVSVSWEGREKLGVPELQKLFDSFDSSFLWLAGLVAYLWSMFRQKKLAPPGL